MKTITTEQLEQLTWTIATIECGDHEFSERPEAVGCDADGEPEMETRYQSYLFGDCLLRCVEHPEITCCIEWQANGGTDTLADAYNFEVEVNPNGQNELDTGSIEIVDEDGEAMMPRDAVLEVGNDIESSLDWEHEVRKHLPTMPSPETIDDIDEDTDMDTIELSRDDGPDVRFQGERIGHATSHHYQGPRNTRWTDLTLYRTRAGMLVCQEVGVTLWEGERTRYAVHVADTQPALVESLGYGWLAKELYAEAGIDAATEIE